MLPGKRPRCPIKRTTSTTNLSLDVDAVQGPQPSNGDVQQRRPQRLSRLMEGVAMMNSYNNNSGAKCLQQQQYHYHGQSDWLNTSHLLPMAPPRNPRRHSADHGKDSAQFLSTCSLCKRRLGPGRETFMYRGEVAFCSPECRQKQLYLDEMKEKCSLIISMKRDSPQFAIKSEASGYGETVTTT